MGGHGGLNILPQKRWNVYNYENREKVRRDEEAAAREEQLKREQAQKRDAEFRLERLRASRGLAPLKRAAEEKEKDEVAEEPVESETKTGHINLFQGIKIFDPVEVPKKDRHGERDDPRRKKMKKEEPRVVAPEDEKYRLGYGVAGMGVKLPWYLERRNNYENVEREDDDGSTRGLKDDGKRKSGKKTLRELREERLNREKKEKERERELIMEKSRRDGGFSKRRDVGFARRR